MVQTQQLWQGPVPSPEDLRGYADVDPDLPNRIVKMAERQLDLAEAQQEHRHVQEDRQVRGLNRRADIGLYMAFVLALFVLAGSFWVISKGHDVAGSSIAGLDLVGLASVFIYGRRDQARWEQRTQEPAPQANGSRRGRRK
jgi:uncharacterized membrane protein